MAQLAAFWGRMRRPLWFSLLGMLVLSGGVGIWHFETVQDDAFISFQYAKQLVRGHGLVFNPGERVEGYTNFLWVMMSAPMIALGWDPWDWAIYLLISP